MTDRPSNDDLLSAFFDGEASPDERAEAERLLAGSPEALRELTEIGEISRVVRSLPRERLPRDFADRVLARAEREMLLAAPADGAVVAPARPGRRARWIALGSVVVTAALVLAVTLLIEPPRRGDELVGRDNRGAEAGNRPEETIALRDRSAPAASEMARAALPAAEAPALREELADQEAAPPTPRMSIPSDSPAGPTPQAPRPEAAPLGAAREAVAEKAAPLADARPDIDLANVQVGDIVSYAKESADGVAVVELTVVDVQVAAGVLKEVLLVRNGAAFGATAATSRDKPDGKPDADGAALEQRADPADQSPAEPAARPAHGELIAMYVESSDERLTAALQQMERNGLLTRRQLRPTVDPARVEVVALQADERNGAGRDAATSEPAPAPAESAVADAAPLAQRQESAEQPLTLAAAVARSKARLGTRAARTGAAASAAAGAGLPENADGKPATRAGRGGADRAVRLRGTPPEAERLGRPTDEAGKVELAEAPAADTFQLLFRPNERSLDAQRGARSAAERFRIDRQHLPAQAADARAAQSFNKREGEADAAPLRVIFVFRQSP